MNCVTRMVYSAVRMLQNIRVGRKYVYCGPKDVRTLEVPDGITEIGKRAFADCGKLISLKLPAGLKRIAKDAFTGCDNLIAIMIPPENVRFGFGEGVLYDKITHEVLFCVNLGDPNSISFIFRMTFLCYDILEVMEALAKNARWDSLSFPAKGTYDLAIECTDVIKLSIFERQIPNGSVKDAKRHTVDITRVEFSFLAEASKKHLPNALSDKKGRYEELRLEIMNKYAGVAEHRSMMCSKSFLGRSPSAPAYVNIVRLYEDGWNGMGWVEFRLINGSRESNVVDASVLHGMTDDGEFEAAYANVDIVTGDISLRDISSCTVAEPSESTGIESKNYHGGWGGLVSATLRIVRCESGLYGQIDGFPHLVEVNDLKVGALNCVETGDILKMTGELHFSFDDDDSVKLRRRAAAEGHVAAQILEAKSCLKDQSSWPEAVQWFRQAAGVGNAQAQYYLGFMYANCRYVERDDAESVKWYGLAAENGNKFAQYELAKMYVYGRGIPQSCERAIHWFLAAAANGCVDALYDLGESYEYGHGAMVKDYDLAREWYLKAAAKHHVLAEFHLGLLYDYGLGVAEDRAEAAKWYRVAAGHGSLNAMGALGLMLRHGRGVDRNDAEAFGWLRKSTSIDPDVRFALGEMYDSGEGVAQNVHKAKRWYRKAAKWYRRLAIKGDPRALGKLAIIYQDGLGVEKDTLKANEFYNRAYVQIKAGVPSQGFPSIVLMPGRIDHDRFI